MGKHKTAKEVASALLISHGLMNPSLDDLIVMIESYGFEIIDYSAKQHDSYLNQLIEELSLRSIVDEGKAITYQNGSVKIVFVCEEMTSEEKRYVLAHELGHIVCEHLKGGVSTSLRVEEEYEANEFAHYFLHPCFKVVCNAWILTHRVQLIVAASILVVAIIAVSVGWHYTLEKSYYGEYYITENGEKYHTKECSIVKGKSNLHRMTKDEFETGKYSPCQICLPSNE